MKATLHIDGGARGNPGPAAAGIVLQDTASQGLLYEAGIFLGKATNNVAEYQGLIKGLQNAIRCGVTQLSVFSDSELMVKQITGQYRVKAAGLLPLYEQAQQLLLKFDLWQIKHVRREYNKRADELANLSMDAGKDVIVVDADCRPAAGERAGGVGMQPPVTPRWTVTLTTIGHDDCPANCPAGRVYAFGPGTPPGFCVYAAQAVFDDEPLFWPQRGTRQATARCAKCGGDLRIELQDQPAEQHG